MPLLSYQEWSEPEKRVLCYLLEQTVSQEQLFIRKLVNATVIRNTLYEHVSNESEEGRKHIIYAAKFQDYSESEYRKEIEEPLFENCKGHDEVGMVLLLWNGKRFVSDHQASVPYEASASMLLLDHYMVLQGKSYETVYSVLDLDMNTVAFYLKDVNV